MSYRTEGDIKTKNQTKIWINLFRNDGIDKKRGMDTKGERGKTGNGGESAQFANSLPHKGNYGIMTDGACQNQAACQRIGG